MQPYERKSRIMRDESATVQVNTATVDSTVVNAEHVLARCVISFKIWQSILCHHSLLNFEVCLLMWMLASISLSASHSLHGCKPKGDPVCSDTHSPKAPLPKYVPDSCSSVQDPFLSMYSSNRIRNSSFGRVIASLPAEVNQINTIISVSTCLTLHWTGSL